jgi:hypothetical protein
MSVAGTPLSTAPPPPYDNAALIGGVVGGVVALVLICGLIAFLVARSRRRREQGEANTGASMQSVRQSMSSGESETGAASQSNLSVGTPQNHSAWPNNDNYAKFSPKHTDYEHGDITKFS